MSAEEFWWTGVPTSKTSARVWKGYQTEEARNCAKTVRFEQLDMGLLIRCEETTRPCTEEVLREALRMGGFPNDLVVSP